jgi:L-iditol 2-dehydrogenase
MIEYVLEEPKKIQRTEKDRPVPGAHEVLVHVKYVGICGSDIHLFNGTYNGPHSLPMLFGHEWAGVIEETGAEVTRFQKGDVVTGDCSRYCGTCENCQADKNLCTHIEKFGITVDGASTEYFVRDEKYIYKAPAEIAVELLCLSEPVAVAAHLLAKVKKLVGSFSGKRILVLGGGVIGMSALMLLAKLEGADHLELYDLAAHRTSIAASVGARIPTAEELNPVSDGNSYEDMYASAKYDVVLETTGVGPVFANALNLVKPNGVLGCVGMIASVSIAEKLIVTKGLTVVGSIGGTGYFDRAMELISRYPKETAKLISHYYPMAQVDDAFATAVKPDQSMKVVLTLD